MSGHATGWVLRQGPRPNDTDKDGNPYGQRARGMRSVLLCVADAANRDGKHAHPGIAAIVEGSLYSRRQVVELLRQLVDDEWLTVEQEGGGRGQATVYSMPRLNSANSEPTAPFSDPETVQSDPLNSAVSPEKGAVCDGNSAVTTPISVPNGLSTVKTNGKEQQARDLALAFDAFWSVYPNKRSKPDARKAWRRAVLAAQDPNVIVAAAARFADDPNRVDGFTPYPATWLNREQWNDPPLPPRTQPSARERVEPRGFQAIRALGSGQ